MLPSANVGLEGGRVRSPRRAALLNLHRVLWYVAVNLRCAWPPAHLPARGGEASSASSSPFPFLFQAIGRSCPLLASLKLSHCSKVTAESLCMLAECCSELESLNLQNSQVSVGDVKAASAASAWEGEGSRDSSPGVCMDHLWDL